MKDLEKTTTAILNALGYPDAELSVVLVDDPQMQQLNRDFRGLDRPTNVLAFSMREGDFAHVSPDLLGDVVISLDTVVTEAAAVPVSASAHFFRMLIHGVLHLVGYDHVQSAEADSAMHRRTEALLTAITPVPPVLDAPQTEPTE